MEHYGHGEKIMQERQGQGNTVDYSSPVQIPGTTWDVVRCIGGASAVATKTDGTAWTWGANWYGELGQNNGVHYSSPTQLPGTWDYLQSGSSSSLTGYQIDQA